MRICIVSGTFPPEVGGPPTYLAQLIPALAARGHSIHVVTYGEPGPNDLPCSIQRISRRAPIPCRLLRLTRAVLRGSMHADLLFVSDYGLPPAIVNQVRGLPLVIKVVGDFAWEYSVRHGHIGAELGIEAFQNVRGGMRIRLLKRIQRAYVSAAQRVIVPSGYLRRIVAGWGVPQERIRVVYNAVPLPDQPASLSGQPPTLLTVARLAPWKGIDTLIRAVGLLNEARPSVKLIVAGDGEDRPRLEELARHIAPGRVEFLGELKKSAVLDQMREASALALASHYEGLSHVLLEGLAMGLPIIASNIDGNRELIAHKTNGWLVTPDDVAGFTVAIRQCVEQPELAQAYGRRNRAWAETHTVDQQVDETLRVCQEAIAARSRGG